MVPSWDLCQIQLLDTEKETMIMTAAPMYGTPITRASSMSSNMEPVICSP